MPFCVQCGAKLDDGAKFCTVCGAKQPEAAAPAYVPPAEEKPAEPQGYSYTPPASDTAQKTGYNYDPTIYGGRDGGQNKPPKKKGGAIVFIILAALVVIGALIFIFSSTKGGKTSSDDPVLGLYSAQKAESNGITISISTMWKNGFTIELKNNGKAKLNVDGKTGSAKWTLDGERFTVKGSGVDCSGTLKDGTLILEDVLGSGVTLYFTKDGAALSTPKSTQAPAAGSAGTPAVSDEILGLYNADKAEAYGLEIEISTMWEKGFSLELLEDGKCNMSVNGTKGSGTWSLNGETLSVSVPGFNMDGTLKDGVLLFEDVYSSGVALYFTKDGSMKPSVSAANTTLPTTIVPATDLSWWDGDWYGWLYIYDAGGIYEEKNAAGADWDACATIELIGSTGTIECWDEDNDYIIRGTIKIEDGLTEKGCITNLGTKFWDYEMPERQVSFDPGDGEFLEYPNTIILLGRYNDPENEGSWFDYTIFLRPWGMRWDDVDEGKLPYYYKSWYLPLIEADKEMPYVFEGLE